MNEEHHLSRQRKYSKRRRKKWIRIMVMFGIVLGLGLGIQHAVGNPVGKWLLSASVSTAPPVAEDVNLGEVGDEVKTGTGDDPANENGEEQPTADKEGETEPGSEGESNELQPQDKQQVTFSFVGDVLLGSTVHYLLEQHGFDYPYEYVKPLLQQSDLTLANLETPITTRGEPVDKPYAYRSHPDVLPAFKEAGFDIVSLANNHILDYGLDGLVSTLRNLRETDIDYVGAGENSEEAFMPVVEEINGLKVAVLGFSRVVPDGSWKADVNRPGVASTYNYTRAVQAIEQASETADLVVVLAHWGEERQDDPNEHQQELARRYVDAGADLVIGSHPHVLQGLEYYNGKWIAYSMGNFIFTTREAGEDAYKTWDSGILQAVCDAAGDCQLKFVPVFTKWAQPRLMESAEAAALIKRLNELSVGVQIEEDGTVEPVLDKKES